MISDDFAFKSKKDGFVEKIDNKNKLAILQYDDGTEDAIDLSDKLNKNSNMGFYIHQIFKMAYAEGEHFKAGDVIAYNPSYFTGKGKDIDYMPGALAKIAVAPGDFSYEDATVISESLSEKCAIKVNMLKPISLGKYAEVHNIVEIGDTVETGDSLIDFTPSYNDQDTAEFLSKLSASMDDEMMGEITRDKVEAKYSGLITNIEIYYNCPLEELSPSLQQLIKKYKRRIAERQFALAGVKTNSVKIPPIEQVNSNKIGKTEFVEGGGVIINIWIEYHSKMGNGDKLTYSTALKGIISKTFKDTEAPISEHRPEEHVEAILTPTGIISRMTSDIYMMLFGNKVLVELGKQIREIWNDDRRG